MHVLFVAPEFPAYQKQFVRALKSVGAAVTGIGEAPAAYLSDDLKGWLDGYEQVRSVCDEEAVLEAVRRVQRRGWVDRLEATIESHILPIARVREAAKIPGLRVKTAILCRDKPEMKAFLRGAGVPCALSDAVESPEEAKRFVEAVGYPVILKPRAAAGASGTWRADDDAGLARALADLGVDRGNSAAIEEFIEGHEGFHDTLAVDGEVVHEFISHYYPGVLEAMRDRSVAPQIISTNRIDAPGYDEVKKLGRRVIQTMGIGTAATHMEWFASPKGLKFSEIGARPPGVGQWDLYCAGNDLDLYIEWAHALVHGRPLRQASRRFSSGIIALRPDQDGHIAGYEGVDLLQEKFGEWVIDAHLPPAGTHTQPIEAGYMANAWVRMRHPNYDTLREMLDLVGQTLKVRAA